jgi:hypothetical protein
VVLADETDKIELTKRCNNDRTFIDNVKFDGSFVKTTGGTSEPLYIELTIDG